MNDYNPTNLLQKESTKVSQLRLPGSNNSPDQKDSQCLVPLSSCISPRVLKVVEIGDFWAKRTMPSIRLQGKWMLRAGVLPNHHVQITNPSPGVLLIQLVDDALYQPKLELNHPIQIHPRNNP
jgi:hypothetical protein